MNIKVTQESKVEPIEIDFNESRIIWEEERNAAADPHEMDGYREEDI